MITVVVPTYNEERNIERCLRALNNQNIPRDSYEIIVVDGDSKDKTREIASKYADKVIRQVSSGVGGARNDGAMVASGQIVATTDADCIPDEDWLHTILEDFDDEEIVAVTGYLDPMIPKEMAWMRGGTYYSRSPTAYAGLARRWATTTSAVLTPHSVGMPSLKWRAIKTSPIRTT